MKATVQEEVILVPLKDYIKYEDGLLQWWDINRQHQTQNDEKRCSSFRKAAAITAVRIFSQRWKTLVIKFQFTETGEVSFTYSHTENYRDIKFHHRIPLPKHYPLPTGSYNQHSFHGLKWSLREFNFNGYNIEKTSVKDGDITRVKFSHAAGAGYKKEPSFAQSRHQFPHIVCVARAFSDGGKVIVNFWISKRPVKKLVQYRAAASATILKHWNQSDRTNGKQKQTWKNRESILLGAG